MAMSDEIQEVKEVPEAQKDEKAPRLFRNYISFAGAAVVLASLASILLLLLLDLSGETNNPYLGIFAYIVLPGFLILGLSIILLGMLRERRRRRRLSPSEVAAYP